MSGRLYRLLRDLHLYFGLFISPFVLLFAISVFFLVHAWLPKPDLHSVRTWVAKDLSLPAGVEALSGRARIEALKPALAQAGVRGEVGWIQHFPKQQRLIVPVTVPGRLTTVTFDLATRQAAIEERRTGLADALVALHKSPGPHLADIRMNWFYLRVWYWFADATVYLVLFITVSGLYLWYALRAERRTGLALLAAGALSFAGLLYALVH